MATRLMGGVAAILMLALLTQCAPARATLTAPTATPPTIVPTTGPKSPPETKAASDGRALLVESIRLLDQANSYQIAISSTLRTSIEGKPRDWKFSGTGEIARPASIQWSLEGSADTFFKVVRVGNQYYCADARGESKNCDLTFGGPRPGASPYTTIAYLRNFDQAGEPMTKSIGGKNYHYLTFAPSLPQVAAIDTAHGRALTNVASVSGEVWIDQNSKLPYQESVTIRYRPLASGEDTVDTTIIYEKYNQPVDIKMSQ